MDAGTEMMQKLKEWKSQNKEAAMKKTVIQLKYDEERVEPRRKNMRGEENTGFREAVQSVEETQTVEGASCIIQI